MDRITYMRPDLDPDESPYSAGDLPAAEISNAADDTAAAETSDAADLVAEPALTSITLPIRLLRAALACASTDQGRSYLNGVFVHRHDADNTVRIVGTDGHRLFVGSCAWAEEFDAARAWLDLGVIISREGLKARLALIQGPMADVARISYAPKAPRINVGDIFETIRFRLEAVAGVFPEYDRVMPDLMPGHAERAPLDAVSFQGAYMKAAADIGAIVGSASVTVIGFEDGRPSAFTFPGAPDALLIIMPISHGSQPVSPAVAGILGLANRGTVGALRAHLTRTEAAIADPANARRTTELHARAAQFRERIDGILGMASLPAPEPTPAPEAEEAVEAAAETAEAPAPETKVRGRGKRAKAAVH